jgi:hypothetical protein
MIMTPRPPSFRLIAGIMLALLVWGSLLALGSFLYGGNRPLVRAAIIFGVTLAFVAFWLAALTVRSRRGNA